MYNRVKNMRRTVILNTPLLSIIFLFSQPFYDAPLQTTARETDSFIYPASRELQKGGRSSRYEPK